MSRFSRPTWFAICCLVVLLIALIGLSYVEASSVRQVHQQMKKQQQSSKTVAATFMKDDPTFVECKGQCDIVYSKCDSTCDTQVCTQECIQDLTDCVDLCPDFVQVKKAAQMKNDILPPLNACQTCQDNGGECIYDADGWYISCQNSRKKSAFFAKPNKSINQCRQTCLNVEEACTENCNDTPCLNVCLFQLSTCNLDCRSSSSKVAANKAVPPMSPVCEWCVAGGGTCEYDSNGLYTGCQDAMKKVVAENIECGNVCHPNETEATKEKSNLFSHMKKPQRDESCQEVCSVEESSCANGCSDMDCIGECQTRLRACIAEC